MKSDEYRTIKSQSIGIYKDSGSKFIALAQNINSINEAKDKLENIRKEYHDARHHCYAYKIGIEDDNWRINDDGEPSGTAGKPIMGQINSFSLTNILIVVVRYFGGTLLGTGGLIKAYKTASSEALKKANIVLMTIQISYIVEFPYKSMNEIMKLIKDEGIEQSDQVFELDCSIKIRCRKSIEEKIKGRLNMINKVKYKRTAQDID